MIMGCFDFDTDHGYLQGRNEEMHIKVFNDMTRDNLVKSTKFQAINLMSKVVNGKCKPTYRNFLKIFIQVLDCHRWIF